MKEPAIWEPILAVVLLFVVRQLFYRLNLTGFDLMIVDITSASLAFVFISAFFHTILVRLNPRVKARGAVLFYRLLFQYDEKGFTHSLLDDNPNNEEGMKPFIGAHTVVIMALFATTFYVMSTMAIFFFSLLPEPFKFIWLFSSTFVTLANIIIFYTLVDAIEKTRGLLYNANITLWLDLYCVTLEVSIDSTKAMQCTMHPLSATKEEVTPVVEPEPVTKCEPIDYYNVLVENQWRLIQTKYLQPDTLKSHIVFNSTDIDTECNTLFKENRQKLKEMHYYVISRCPCDRNEREVCMNFQKIDVELK